MKDIHEFKYPYNLLKHLGAIAESDILTPTVMKSKKNVTTVGDKLHYIETTRFGDKVFIKVYCDEKELNASLEYVLHHLEEDEYELIKRRYTEIISLKKLAEERLCRVEEIDAYIDKAIKRISTPEFIRYLKFGVQGVERKIIDDAYDKYKELSLKILEMQSSNQPVAPAAEAAPADDISAEDGQVDALDPADERSMSPADVLDTLKQIDILEFDSEERVFRINEGKVREIYFKNVKALEYDEGSGVFRMNKEYFRKLYMSYNKVKLPDTLDITQKIDTLNLVSAAQTALLKNNIHTIEDILFIGIDDVKKLQFIGSVTYNKITKALADAGVERITN